ncbi:FHIPEP family type III secretion protein [Yersinia enterocolitica]|uniref:FHIPEP family type III secretion protein n=1 Tax=Yersinia TaxID=629 RepID=UPI001C60D655|nr:FHIPEP family type III secretion protein [Yersinia kristensenii]EKN4037949.1 FHIPEP family type III secretion protein [Yersinia enterocolitica]MBW5812555.1 FHIPEP family type III secretion protein [Yersinia kristensenii]MBW5817933.1 FHIPEP family type III secretion protein [Yersinia kristensenii]MBW5829856.1 FHIPEP family type III secretion protein [Yersinia kristensenii]MBW5842249.1 FHIPEP family type III secretion protein [Yersinia kristensenii]
MINRIRNFSGWVKPGSVVIALMLPTVILVPLPGFIIDIFVLLSFIVSVMLLVIMLENDKPLRVTFLPTVVLLLTTFRLLLSIATTRNILANEEVGSVIEIVGNFVMGAGLLSGLIIFVIITIVQFMVVTKGGERVAEVGARFSLDALPGRQMTIDGDLKNNMITGEQAQRLRAELSTENKLFGSLEGAMKFIKGDAIAGILISLVNLFGGIYVGINQFDLSLSDSVQRFSILTIGDGLVSQIPSLLLSVACGVYLTRIKGIDEESSSFLGQIINQVGVFWKSLALIGVFMMFFGGFNADLTYVCVPIALACLAASFYLWRGQSRSVVKVTVGEGRGLYESLSISLKDNKHQHVIYTGVSKIETSLWGQELGKPCVVINPNLDSDIEVSILGIKLYSFSQKKVAGMEEIMGDEIFIHSADITDNLTTIVNFFLRKRMIEKYNIQFTSNIIDKLSEKSEVMKKEIDSAIGINRVHDVLKQMINCPEFYLDCVSFFESLIYWSRLESEPKNWLMRIRTQARYEITSRLVNSKGEIFGVLLPAELTEVIESFVSGEEEDIDTLMSIRQSLRSEIFRLTEKNGVKPVVLVNDTDINFVQSFMYQIISTLAVCSYNDITQSELIKNPEMLKINL